jgi:hypothetical protein
MLASVRRAALLIALAACGRLDFDPLGPTTYRDAVLADRPVAYWRLGDIGATAADETGALPGSYRGTCQHGQAGALAGDADTATRFDGATCEIQLADALNFAANEPFAVELWASQATNTGYYHYFTRESRTAGNLPIDGYALVQANPGASPMIGVYLERVVAMSQLNTAPVIVTPGRWTYLVAQYDGAALDLFVDGASVSRVVDSQPMTTFSIAALIGANPSGGFYAGVMDEVAVYDHVLPAERIALHRTIALDGPQ